MKKKVLITGASRGIGESCARLFSNNKYNVIINYFKSQDKAMKLAKSIPNAIAIKTDVSKRSEVKSMIKEIGDVDILINNAGVSQQKLFTDITEKDWDKMFDINIKGMFNCCQEIIPSMIRRHEGKVINISSIWGINGASCEVHYSASKAAVIGFTKALAKELGPSNIQVNCVAPGIIKTDMNSKIPLDILKELKEETPLGVLGEPKNIAETVLFLASDKANFITGQVISPNGGFLI